MIFMYLLDKTNYYHIPAMHTGHIHTSIFCELYTELSTALRINADPHNTADRLPALILHELPELRVKANNISSVSLEGLQYAVFKATRAITGKRPIW